MRILISSHSFAPSIGGIEAVSETLAREFVSTGNEVKLATQTAGRDGEEFPFEVTRRPSPRSLLAMVRWCDIYWHNGISLRTAWPLLLAHRPWVITHAGFTSQGEGASWWQRFLKLRLAHLGMNVAICQAMLGQLPNGSRVIGNPFDDGVFNTFSQVQRVKDLVFLGRLVQAKGLDLLLEALFLLQRENLRPSLTVVGVGPDEQRCRRIAAGLEHPARVAFLGAKQGEELARLLNAHRVLVVPSRWPEPFGIVALEGIACGCVIIGSQGGGLPEAIGPCGVTFPNNDSAALASRIRSLLGQPLAVERYRAHAGSHLPRFTKRAVAEEYLRAFREAAT